jgi:hypothetical protein
MGLNANFKPLLQGEWLLIREGKSTPTERVVIRDRKLTRYGCAGKLQYGGIWNGEWSIVPDGRWPECFSLVFIAHHYELGSAIEGWQTAYEMVAKIPGLPVNKLGSALGAASLKHVENKHNAEIRAGREWHYPLLNHSKEKIRMVAGRRWQPPAPHESTYNWTMIKRAA